ncbi:MAG: amino acid adenylation domain-containing protein, partial [Acidobacteriota bacterium]
MAVCLERTDDLVVTLLGVLGAGGAYLPLDPAYPAERLRFMASDAGARLLVAEEALADRFEGLDLQRLSPTELRSDAGESVPVDPDSLAYLIYTSGSTGTPKGVAVSHRNAVAMLQWGAERFSAEELRGSLAVTSVCFDLSVYELFLPLATGGSVILARDILHLLTLPARDEVTLVNTVPSAIAEIVRAEGLPPSVRTVNLAGEPLKRDLVDRVYRAGAVERVYNLYGPSEDTTYSTWALVPQGDDGEPTIGRPIANGRAYVLDPRGEPIPVGLVGELYLAGAGVTRGYHDRPAATAERYVPDPFAKEAGARLYRTGDRVRWRGDGELEFLGRFDHQVKLRGFRIELGEIEAALTRHPAVEDAAVLVREDRLGEPLLAGFVAAPDAPVDLEDGLRSHLGDGLPAHMVPSILRILGELPLTPNGKIDRRALESIDLGQSRSSDAAAGRAADPSSDPRDGVETRVAAAWREVLELDAVGLDDTFFSLGGHSLLLPRVFRLLTGDFPDLTLLDLLQFPTVRKLAIHLRGGEPAAAAEPKAKVLAGQEPPAVAILSVAGRFPGAEDVDAFWRNVAAGVEAIRGIDVAAAVEAGETPDRVASEDYVPVAADLEGVDRFDPDFFQMSVRDAAMTDPQQRLFLEHAWEALERAGYGGGRGAGAVGVYAGASLSAYLVRNILPHLGSSALEDLQTVIGLDKDFLATRVAHKLGLTGPALTVQTACSTSLVAVHQASLALLAGDCDMALAGGATVKLPQGVGYTHVPDSILSKDGHCRAFDADAGGTVAGSGVGVVVLKRLAEAQADGDPIVAVIRGTAINNDGDDKVGFTAPSVDGQTRVVRRAMARAGVEPDSVGYVECHGTGTKLGDPVEVRALKRAFGDGLEPGTVALSSAKTIVGHLDAAAGITGLVRAAQALQHRTLPPNLHFRTPNPELGLEGSPFWVPSEATPWPRGRSPRRAGVSAFGIGGTNAHAILEEAPAQGQGRPGRPYEILRLSARTPGSLDAATRNLAAHFGGRPVDDESTEAVHLADAAYTLHVGRRGFQHRRIAVVASTGEAAEILGAGPSRRLLSGFAGPSSPRRVHFLFPGQGAQHVGMARGTYAHEPIFRRELDACAEVLAPHLGLDLRDLLFATGEEAEEAASRLRSTDLAQPALFAVEWSLATLWMSWGLEPAGMLGHSLGELVAATAAGVFDRDDALALVALRGRLMQSMPPGAMLGLQRSVPEIEALLEQHPDLVLAVCNGETDNVVSGPSEAVDALAHQLAGEGIETRRLHTSHAFHSPMMEPILDPFRAEVARIGPKAPRRPFVSNLTGGWIEPSEAIDPDYWARHLRHTVRFADGLGTLLEDGDSALLEVGPGRVLTTLARRRPDGPGERSILPSLPHPKDERDDLAALLETAGSLWMSGLDLDPAAHWRDQGRRRVVLPTYPFERRRCWVSPPETAKGAGTSTVLPIDASPSADPMATAGAAVDGPPRDPVAAAVTEVWRELLGLAHVALDDSFFEVGGHSLLATQMANRLRQTFGVEIRANELLTVAQTPGDQAALVTEKVAERRAEERADVDDGGPVPRDPGEDGASLPMSPGQERLWFLSQLSDQASTAYNITFLFRFTGPLDPDALVRAFGRLVARHEALRTALKSDHGRPIQVIHTLESPDLHLEPVEVVDLGVGADQVDAKAKELAAADTQRPFALDRAPLWRVRLLRADDGEHYLLGTFHHTIFDGWSHGVLLAELEALYRLETGRGGAEPEPLPVQFPDVAAWQRQRLDSGALDDELEYWRRRLEALPGVLELPTDRPRPATPSHRGARLAIDLPAALAGRAAELSRAEGVTLFVTLLATFQTLLWRLSGQRDVAVGTPVANRDRLETEGLVGFLVNTLVMRTEIDPADTFRQLLGRVKDTVTEAFDHRELPFERLVEELRPERLAGANPLFQVAFSLQNMPGTGDDFAGLGVELLDTDTPGAPFDLSILLEEAADGGLRGLADYATELFEGATVRRFLDAFERLLKAAVDGPDRRLRDLELVPDFERERLLAAAHRSAAHYPRDSSLGVLFAETVSRHRQRTAVIHGDLRWTYGELAARSGAVTAFLRRRGIRPGDRVAVCMDRSADQVAALLGIVSAGAAYVPIDPAYPEDRLRLILKDTGSALALVHGHLEGALPAETEVEAIPLDRLWSEIEGTAEEDVAGAALALAAAGGDTTAYVVYTSGSTGRPKGVEIPHRGVTRLVRTSRYL